MFAATGWTQAGWFLKLALCWLAVIYIFSRVILGWRLWSWKPVLLAAGLALAIGILFTPWSSLADLKSRDPDVLTWHSRFRATAFAWMLAAAASFLSLPIIWALRGRYAAPGPDELWLFVWGTWKKHRLPRSRPRPIPADDFDAEVTVDEGPKLDAAKQLKMAKTTGDPAAPGAKPEP